MQKTRLLAESALMCALMIVSTLWLKFTLPGTDMLVTTQVFFVLLCGLVLPPAHCFYAIGGYVALGLMGLPVFSATQGAAVVVTPSFGYLLAFPFAAALASWLRSRLGSVKGRYFIASFAGMLAIYLIALPYIAAIKGLYLGAPIPFDTLMTAYCLAFLPLDAAKAVLAALLASRLEKALARS